MSQSELETYYAERAAEYDDIYERPERQSSLRRVKSLVQEYFQDRSVLEIACGTGYWTREIASTCRTIHALDLNESVLEIARRRLANTSHVNLIRADAYAIPEFDVTFDAGFAGFWYSHIPIQQTESFFDAFHTRLQKGARVCLVDNLYVEGNSTKIAYCDEHGNTFQTRRLKDGREYDVLKNFPLEDDLFQLLGKHVDEFRFEMYTYYWALMYRIRT